MLRLLFFIITLFFFPRLTPGALFLMLIPLNKVEIAAYKSFSVKSYSWFQLSTTLFFMAYAFGMIYTENTEAGLRSLELKLSFLLLPLALPLIISNRKMFVFRTLRALSLVAFVFCLIYILAVLLSFGSNISDSSVFAKFKNPFLHPSYLAVYLMVIFNFEAYFTIGHWQYIMDKKLKRFQIILLSVLMITTVLTQAKIGLLVILFSIIGQGVYLAYSTKAYIKVFSLGVVLFSILASSIYFSPLKLRLEQMYEELTTELRGPKAYMMSTRLRLEAQRCTKVLIKENYWTGVGTGDIRDQLNAKYVELGLTALIKKKLDSHEQFLQTRATVGWLGLIALIGMFLSVFYIGIRKRNVPLLWIGVCFFLFALTESMFERQAGVIFFAFMTTLVIILPKQKRVL